MGLPSGSTRTSWTEGSVALALLAFMLSLFSLIGTAWGEWTSEVPLPKVEECISTSLQLSEGTYILPQNASTIGLWHACVEGFVNAKNASCCYPLGSSLEGWHTTCQVLYTLGVGLALVALMLLTIVQCCADYRGNIAMIWAFIVLQTISGIFTMAAVIAFRQHIGMSYSDGSTGNFGPSWSLQVAAAATALTFVSGTLAVVQVFRLPIALGENQRLHDAMEMPDGRSGFDGINFEVQMDSPSGSHVVG